MEALRKSALRPTAQTRLGFYGKLEAGSEFPFEHGMFEASASGELKLDYYFYSRGSTVLASALASALAGLESPFDVDALQDQLAERDADGLLTQARLHSVQIQANRAMSVGGKIALSTPFSLAAGVAGTISGDIGFSIKRSGDFAYRVSGAPQSRDLMVELERAVTNGSQFEANLGIGIDLTEALTGIQQGLLEHLGEAAEFLKEAKALLLTGDEARAKLTERVDAAIADLPQADLIRSLIGFDADNTASDLLTKKLVETTERHIDKWKAKSTGLATRTAQDIVVGTLGGMQLQPFTSSELEGALLQPVTDFLDDIESELKERIKKLVEGDHYVRIADLLDKPGTLIDRSATGAVARYNRVVDPIRERLSRFQTQLAQVTAVVEKAAEFKVKANLSYERSESHKRTLALKVLLRPQVDRAEAQKRLYELLLGQMNSVFDELRNTPTGGVIEALEGTLLSTANLDEKSGIDVMVIDFQLSNSSMLDVDVAYQVDLNGDVSVTSRAEMANRVRTLREARRVNFINVFKLASASGTGSLLINSAVSYKDQNLKVDELRGFLSGFEDAHNIADGETDKAVSVLETLLAQRPGEDVGGELSVYAKLNKGNIEQLLQVDAPVFNKERVWNVALPLVVHAIEDEGFFEFRLDSGVKTWLKDNHDDPDFRIPGDLEGAIRAMDAQTAKRIELSHREGYYGVDEFTHRQYCTTFALRHERIENLAKAFALMREVYLSRGRDWDETVYVQKQEQLDEVMSAWIRPGKKNIPFFAVVTKEVRPMLVAFYTILRELSGSGPMEIGVSLSDGNAVKL